jgi:inner membrane protein
MFLFSVLSMFPDSDVIAFALGISYDAPWGHRGATHSIVFGLLLAAVATVLAIPLELPRLRTFVVAAIVAVSHGLLDCLTNGGLGCALLWPFSDERFFAPVRPLPVAPIGLHMLSNKGLMVTLVELIFFSPFFIYATFPRRPKQGPLPTPGVE